MFATVAGGAFMWLVHFLSKAMPEQAYSQFGVLLSVAMCVPIAPLQMVLAQQTARGLALGREHELSSLIRFACLSIFGLWLVVVAGVWLLHGTILADWKITDSAALWLTLPVLLFTAWQPLLWGVLQGQQNFLWLGWSMIANGVGRVIIAAFFVLVVGVYASGMVGGIVAGLVFSLVLSIWPTRSLWLAPPQPFDWRGLLRQVMPLMVGAGAYQFLLTADTMFVKGYFSGEESAYYVSAGTLARASMWLAGPLALVMFPKIVHARARSETTDIMGVALIGTLVLSAGGAAFLCVMGPWIVRFMFKPSYVATASVLLPWYAWAVVPLSVANVLLSNLLAHSRFKVVPMLCVLAVGYVFALTRFHATPVMVIKTLSVCNSLLLAICAWYTWGVAPERHSDAAG